MKSMMRYVRFAALVVATLAATMPNLSVAASPNTAVSGRFVVHQVSGASAPVELVAGTNNDVWFVTALSQLGHISSAGQITLLTVTVPHGTVVATLVGADADGVWAFGDTSKGTQCTVSLVRPSGQVMQRTFGHPIGVCQGGALDGSGNLWVSVAGVQGAYETCPCRMVQVSASGAVAVYQLDTLGARPTAVALGTDGAIWVLENNQTHYGRYTAGGSSTSVPLGGTVPPPYPGTDFWGLVPHQLFARPDGTFWLGEGGCCNAVALSSPGRWIVRYLLPFQASIGAMTPDGSMWTVNFDRNGPSTQRLVRTEVNGQLDRSAVLPTGAGGQTMQTTGILAATSGGAIWTVTSDGSAKYLVEFQPL